MDARGAASLALRSHGAISWYLDGARTNISLAADPLFGVIVRPDGDEVVATSNEVDRLLAEELPPDVAVTALRWDEPIAPLLDRAVLQESDVASELAAARSPLLPAERSRFARLSAEASEVLTDTALGARPTHSERHLAAALASGLVERGMDPLVVLVAGADRLHYRHPLPTASPLGRRFMMVVCGRRNGLITNVTRWVRFGGSAEPDEERILGVEAAFFDAVAVDVSLADVFRAGTAAYADHGFDPGEWQRHHQGGVAGYNGRDPRATAATEVAISAHTAFAFNPTAPGVKVEDTVMFDGSRMVPLTVDVRWPTVTVAGRRRPVELER